MAGVNDSITISGDWVLPSPSSRDFFASMLGDDIGSKMTPEIPGDSKSGELFQGTMEQMTRPLDEKSTAQSRNQFGESSSVSELRQASRGGLVERMAARAGFNAPRLNTESFRSTDLSVNTDIRSPYLTIPPGLSPTTLLESPVFLTNSLAQPSPTTGKFSFVTNGSGGNAIPEATTKSKDYLFEDMNASFAFKPVPESSSLYFGVMSRITPATLAQQPFPSEVSVQSDNSLRPQNTEPVNVQSQNQSSLTFQTNFSRLSTEKHNGANIVSEDCRVYDQEGGSTEQSTPLDEPLDEEGDQRASGDSIGCIGGAPSDDGYNWRKYGQKQVKGSEYPRSYYKCTHSDCPVKKKVERSHEGHITEIIYKGAHNHPKPPPNRRSALGASNPLNEMQPDVPDTRPHNGANGDPIWSSAQKGTAGGTSDWRQDSIEVTSSASMAPEYGNGSASLQIANGTPLESADAVDASSTFSNEEDEDDCGTHGSVSQVYDGEGDESESKRRKLEAYASEMSGATRAIREPRVVVQTTSEVDILDDGYRWRKYGQKVVKGNPNPRSYYKCTSAGCTVRKHVERASHDLKSVITTYEGKHNHDVPAARNSSHVHSGTSTSMTSQSVTAMQTQMQRQEPAQVYNSMVRPTFGSYSLPGRQQLGPSPCFSFGMNQPTLANLAMAGLGPEQPKVPLMPVNQYITQPRQVNDMGFMIPKGEMKMEPMSEPGPNIPNNSSIYQQLMSRLPLGPQM